MNQKQMFIFISLWFFTIGSFYLGFSWLTLSSHCDIIKQDISRITASQDNLLVSFGVFGKKETLKKLKVSVNVREQEIKAHIELFKENCQEMRYKRQLVSILKLYETYLYMKQVILQEKQDFEWHQSLWPEELVFKK